MNIKLLPVNTLESFQGVEALASPIWREHYTPIIGVVQVEYILNKFQTVKAIECQIDQGAQYFLIQTPEGEKAGFLSVIPRAEELFLSKLYLLKTHRRKGIARDCLKFIQSLARERNLDRITLTVHKQNPSVKIYQAMGFHIQEPMVTDIGDGFVMDDYRMALNLAGPSWME